MTPLPVTFEHWPAGILAVAACAALVMIAIRRRPAVPRATLVFVAAGCALLALAAGGMAWLRPVMREITVYLDLSPSTRGALFRQAGDMTRRVRELVGDKPYHVICFAEHPESLPNVDFRFHDIPARHTMLPETDAPFILLFSDGRFAKTPDVLPPVYSIVDPSLDRVSDAAVTSLTANGDEVTIGVRNTGDAPRPLALQGVTGTGVIEISPGSITLKRRADPSAGSISATFSPGDHWPENDSLRTLRPPSTTAERWWITSSGSTTTASGPWRTLAPGDLPMEPNRYLGASLVVLDNVAADALDDARRAMLDHYVRTFGGGLLILGGQHAFAAGGYAGTLLDALSPLASTPPEPTTHWVLLADASGSMNQDGGADGAAPGRTRWQYAAEAVAGAVRQLPPADVVSIGSFADAVQWWLRRKPVREVQGATFPPADAHPHGATSLESALREIATTTTGDAELKLPTRLLVATDAQTTIDRAAEIGAQLKSRGVTLHLLLIGDAAQATALPALQSIITATGGTLRVEQLPQNWSAGVRDLLRAVQPSGINPDAATVRFVDPLGRLAPVQANPWNRTWPKANTTPLAEASVAGERVTMAAKWNVGEGQVGAIAFAPPGSAIDAVAKLLERPPRDPRFHVAVEPESMLRLSVDAFDGKTYLNGEPFTLEFLDETSGSVTVARPILQTAPGHYEISTDAPPRPTIARVRHGAQTLDAVAIAGRFSPEFDAVGNDRAALADLARRTGGAVIEPGDTRRLDLPIPRRPISLASWLATAGAALIAAGLVRWRRGS